MSLVAIRLTEPRFLGLTWQRFSNFSVSSLQRSRFRCDYSLTSCNSVDELAAQAPISSLCLGVLDAGFLANCTDKNRYMCDSSVLPVSGGCCGMLSHAAILSDLTKGPPLVDPLRTEYDTSIACVSVSHCGSKLCIAHLCVVGKNPVTTSITVCSQCSVPPDVV